MKSDERILGDGEFVVELLSKTKESFEQRYALKSAGVDLNFIVERVAALLDMSVEDVWREGKFKHLVRARGLLCFWAVRELGLSMASISRWHNIETELSSFGRCYDNLFQRTVTHLLPTPLCGVGNMDKKAIDFTL